MMGISPEGDKLLTQRREIDDEYYQRKSLKKDIS